ncbi:hypothetical protein [Methylocystis echinoides]|uniref:Uncharacterized protein n=1 Tax=Methylocystis echinoides TaxID=29468 RepID=A0A9W6GZW4_9HYPH|nr:hypothetical protein [Methylocystis echinoides]GLI95986.1 hypothetical protein LMG27198_49780 [Methylocystis echinoides]
MKTILIIVAAAALATPAHAAIPVDDAAQLSQHSLTASTTVKLVPVTTQRKDANSGVKCAVTTGKKANVTDPTVKPQAGAGSQAIRSYAPDMPAAPDPGAQGGALNSQTLFQSSGNVVAGLDASRSTLGAAQSGFQVAGQQVGSGSTVMAAMDMNSAARLQNNLAWNGVVDSTNLWVTALNALNLARTSDMSRAAGGMRAATVTGGRPASGPVCPAGMIGTGSPTDPCRTPTGCSTTLPGTNPDPGCVSARYVDTDGNVIFYLAQAQGTPTNDSASAGPGLTVADVAAALAAINNDTR